MDILEALADEAPPIATGKCRVQRWLDGIDPKTPNLDVLVATLTADDPEDVAYRSLPKINRVVRRLGLPTSEDTIGNHRARRCKCFD